MTQDKKFSRLAIDFAAIDKAIDAAWLALPPSERGYDSRQKIARTEQAKSLAGIVSRIAEVGGDLSHVPTQSEIFESILEQEKRLSALGIPKSLWRGLRIVISGDKQKKRNYKYRYQCVEVVLERKGTAWVMVECDRQTCFPGSVRPSGIRWPIDPAQLEALKARVLCGIFPESGCY